MDSSPVMNRGENMDIWYFALTSFKRTKAQSSPECTATVIGSSVFIRHVHSQQSLTLRWIDTKWIVGVRRDAVQIQMKIATRQWKSDTTDSCHHRKGDLVTYSARRSFFHVPQRRHRLTLRRTVRISQKGLRASWFNFQTFSWKLQRKEADGLHCSWSIS